MSGTETQQNGWSEYRRLLLSELERLNRELVSLQEKLNKELELIRDKTSVADQALRSYFDGKFDELNNCLSEVKRNISLLNYKSGIWGLMGGAIPVCVGFLVWLLQSVLKGA